MTVTCSTGETADTYSRYLRTTHWRVTRDRIRLTRVKCERCQEEAHLHVHHKTYERIGRELDSDLELLCRKCHRIAHSGPRLKTCPLPTVAKAIPARAFSASELDGAQESMKIIRISGCSEPHFLRDGTAHPCGIAKQMFGREFLGFVREDGTVSDCPWYYSFFSQGSPTQQRRLADTLVIVHWEKLMPLVSVERYDQWAAHAEQLGETMSQWIFSQLGEAVERQKKLAERGKG